MDVFYIKKCFLLSLADFQLLMFHNSIMKSSEMNKEACYEPASELLDSLGKSGYQVNSFLISQC